MFKDTEIYMRTTSRIFVAALALLCLSGPALPAQDFRALLAPDPAMAAAAQAQEPLSVQDLAELAFRASGVGETELGTRMEKLQALFNGLDRSLKAHKPKTEAAKAEAVLTWLHENVFKAYSENATTIDLIQDTGRFNCVSSAVFYLVALRSQGIVASGIKTRDHAFAVVRAGGRLIDVETTNGYGFDPGTKKEFTGTFGSTTGYAYTPPGNYANRTAIGEKQLVALILSNRIASYEGSGRYAESLPLGLSYLFLYGGDEGQRIFLDCVENLASRLANSRDFAGIEALAGEAQAVTGPNPRLQDLLEKSTYNRLSLASQRGDWVGSRNGAEAALGSGRLSRSYYESILVYSYGMEAQALGAKGDWLGAAALASEGAAKVKGDSSLARAVAVFRQNFVVESHNRFAALYNKGDYAGAVRVLEEALARLPGNRDLQADLDSARRALAGKR